MSCGQNKTFEDFGKHQSTFSDQTTNQLNENENTLQSPTKMFSAAPQQFYNQKLNFIKYFTSCNLKIQVDHIIILLKF